MNLEYRPYVCTVCGYKEKLQTNHEGDVLAYCKGCSWKRDFAGKDKSHYFPQLNGHTYRQFTFDRSVNEVKGMPSKSEKQRRFFGLVRGVQSGKVHPAKVGPEVRKVARSISTKDAGDFASSVAELKVKKAVLSVLKELHEPMYLNEMETNPVAKTFNQTAKFDDYIKKFQGLPISPKEMEAINSFQGVKPTKIERTQIRYETTDTFNNSTATVIKKLREGNQFVFTAFTKFDQTGPEEPEDAPIDPNAPPQPEEPLVPEEEMDEIVVTKSTSFNDDIKGGAILAEFLKKLDL